MANIKVEKPKKSKRNRKIRQPARNLASRVLIKKCRIGMYYTHGTLPDILSYTVQNDAGKTFITFLYFKSLFSKSKEE
jgi:hypothetical protein